MATIEAPSNVTRTREARRAPATPVAWSALTRLERSRVAAYAVYLALAAGFLVVAAVIAIAS